MVGYVTSADSTNNWINIEITVLYADDFIFESYGCEREVYHYNRVAGKIYRVFPERDEIINATYQTLIDAVDLIKCIEAYEECPIKMRWIKRTDTYVEGISCEPMNGVRMPHMILFGHSMDYINVTGLFFDRRPKPLECSAACSFFNAIMQKSGIVLEIYLMSCHDCIYCPLCLLAYLERSLKSKAFLFNGDPYKNKEVGRYLAKQKLPSLKPDDMAANISDFRIAPQDDGKNIAELAMMAERNALERLVRLFAKVIYARGDINRLFKSTAEEAERYAVIMKTLAGVLVAGETISSANDILYLSKYEAMSGFAIMEERLRLKKHIRKWYKYYSSISAQPIPDILSEYCEPIYL